MGLEDESSAAAAAATASAAAGSRPTQKDPAAVVPKDSTGVISQGPVMVFAVPKAIAADGGMSSDTEGGGGTTDPAQSSSESDSDVSFILFFGGGAGVWAIGPKCRKKERRGHRGNTHEPFD